MQRTIYLSGMISGGGKLGMDEQQIHIDKAVQDAIRIWKMGHAYVITPHINSPWNHVPNSKKVFQEITNTTCSTEGHTRILKSDRTFLQRIDAMYMMAGWGESKGAVMEHDSAKYWGIPIFYSFDKLEKFLKGRPKTCAVCKRTRKGLTKMYGKQLCGDCLPVVEQMVKCELTKDNKQFLKVPRME